MKPIMLTVVVLGAASVVGNAAITTTCLKTGTYTVTSGTGAEVVDVYTITGYSDGQTLGPNISAYEAYAKGPMFQVWRADPNYDEGNIIGWINSPSPTLTGANLLTATQKDADSHFLHSDTQYLVTPERPTETNDMSFGYISYPGGTIRRYFG